MSAVLMHTDRLGADARPVSALGWILLGAAGVIVPADIVALGPARVAARTRPAEILRTE